MDNCYQGVDASGNAVGYVAQVTVTGFGGPIEVTVGVNAKVNSQASSAADPAFPKRRALAQR